MRSIYGYGKVENGKLILSNQQIFKEELKDLSGNIVIEVKEGRAKRSNRQNRYLWSIPYKLLSNHTGYTSEEIHEICKYKFLRAHYEVGEEKYDVGKSTTKLSTTEFEEYAENIRRWGATLGVVIPEPNQTEFVE